MRERFVAIVTGRFDHLVDSIAIAADRIINRDATRRTMISGGVSQYCLLEFTEIKTFSKQLSAKIIGCRFRDIIIRHQLLMIADDDCIPQVPHIHTVLKRKVIFLLFINRGAHASCGGLQTNDRWNETSSQTDHESLMSNHHGFINAPAHAFVDACTFAAPFSLPPGALIAV